MREPASSKSVGREQRAERGAENIGLGCGAVNLWAEARKSGNIGKQ